MPISIKDRVKYARQQDVYKQTRISNAEAACEFELRTQAEILDQLQARVLKGEPIEDEALYLGVVGMYGGKLATDPQILDRYERVSQAMKGRKGDIAVTFSRSTESMANGASPLNNFLKIDTTVCLGELTGEDIVFDFSGKSKTAALPTDRHAVYSNKRPSTGGMAVLERNIIVDEPLTIPGLHMGYRLDEPLTVPFVRADPLGGEVPMVINAEEPTKLKSCEVLIGQEAISQWLGEANNLFKREDELAKMKMCCYELGIKAIEGMTALQRR